MRNLERADVGLGHAHILGLAARIAAIQMAVAEQAGARRSAFLVDDRAATGVGGFAGGKQRLVAVEARAAGNDEGHDDAVTGTQVGDAGADLLHDAHELVAEDVAIFHGRDLAR